MEDLIAALLVRTVNGAVRIDGSGGDGGVDVVVRGAAGDHVFEIKSFSRRLTAAQRRQVLKSLRTAVERQPGMVAWTLVLPLDPSPSEDRWLRAVLAAETTADVTWMGRTAVEAAFAERPDLARAFLPGSSERRAMELLAEQGMGQVLAGGQSAGSATGHSSKPQAGSGGVRNAIVDGRASVVLQSGSISGDVLIPVTVHRALAEVAAQQLPPAAELIGRAQELAVLRDVLCSEASAGGTVVVTGMAGVGKTALAVKAAHGAADRGRFPGGVLFLDLCGYDRAPVSSARALDSLLRGLGVPGEEIPPETADRAGLYRSVLASSAGPVLVVLDNALSPGQVQPLLPGDARHCVLVTSRHLLPQLGARQLELGVLSPGEAVGLLGAAVHAAGLSDTRIRGDPSSSHRVASYCGHLPLALQIAAALLVFEPAKPVAELAGDLAQAHTRLDYLDDGERAVRAAFDLSYQRLPPDQARLFRLLGVHPGPDVAAGTVAMLADRDEPVARRMLAGLARAHLVEPAAVRGRWRMHDLIGIYAGQVPAQAGERQSARDRLCDHLLNLADAADDHVKALPGTPLPAGFSGRDEALAWFDAERATLVAVTSMAAEHGRDDIAHHLPARLVEYFGWRRYLDDWLVTATISKEAAERLRDPHLEAVALNNYGSVLRELGQFGRAVEVCQNAVALACLTGDRPGEAGALMNLGLALRYIPGQVDEAVRICSQACDALRRLGDQRGEAHALNNLGNALHEAGRIEEAGSVHREHLDLCRRTGDRVGEMRALLGLGNVFERTGELRMAADSYETALAICRETGNAGIQSVLLNNLGDVLRRLGRAQEAAVLHQQDFENCRESRDLPGDGRALIGIALALDELGNPDEALATCRRAVKAAKSSNHSGIELLAQTTLLNMLFQRELRQEAIVTSQQVLDLFRRSGQPANEAIAHFNLGLALVKEECPREAIRAYSEAVSLFRMVGDRHGEAQALNLRGNTFFSMRHLQQAERDHTKALRITRKIDDQFNEGFALVGLGNALMAAKRPKDAMPILRQAVDVTRRNGDTQRLVLALCNLGAALMDTGRGKESFPLYDEAVQVAPDIDPLAILCMGTGGKVQPFEMYLLNLMHAAERGDQSDHPHSQPTLRKRPKKRAKRRR